MANTLTILGLCKQSYRLLAQHTFTSTLATLTDPKIATFLAHYATTRDELLEDHFWNFATVRAIVRAYAEPAGTLTPGAVSGDGVTFTSSITGVFGLDAVGKRLEGDTVAGKATIVAFVTTSPGATLTPGATAITPGATGVIFTAAAAVFASGDVGKLIDSVAGDGVALITAFTDTSHVVATIVNAFADVTAIGSGSWRLVRTDQVTADITTAFASTAAIAAEAWRLWNAAPAWGFAYSLTLPGDYLRIQRARDGIVYQREGDYLVANEDTLSITYTQRVEDVTRFPAFFVAALVAAITAKLAEPVTGQRTKQVDWVTMAETKLRRAKLKDAQEGSPAILRASDLADARRGLSPIRTTQE